MRRHQQLGVYLDPAQFLTSPDLTIYSYNHQLGVYLDPALVLTITELGTSALTDMSIHKYKLFNQSSWWHRSPMYLDKAAFTIFTLT